MQEEQNKLIVIIRPAYDAKYHVLHRIRISEEIDVPSGVQQDAFHCRYYSFLLSVSFSMLPYLEDMEDLVDQDISSNASITRFSSVYSLSGSWTEGLARA